MAAAQDGAAPRAARATALPEPGGPGSAPTAERLAYSVDEAAFLTGLSRDLLYDELRRGNLHYRKVGRRRLITRQNLEEFLGLVPRPRAPVKDSGNPGAAGCGH